MTGELVFSNVTEPGPDSLLQIICIELLLIVLTSASRYVLPLTMTERSIPAFTDGGKSGELLENT